MITFLIFAFVGFVAQAVDGALGMAYGVVATTTLLTFGFAPAQASAATHGAELFTTAASGTSHIANRNIDWKLFWHLAPFGILGGVVGTYVLTSFDGSVMRPFIAGYMLLIGSYLFFRSFKKIPSKPVQGAVVAPLGAAGGFFDAVGGGGWGPVVTTGLLGAGGAPRYVIGTVNTTEFLVTLAVSASFVTAILTGHWEEAGDLMDNLSAVGGLVVGGLLAAPMAGILVRKIPEKVLLRSVGTLIFVLAIYQFARYFGVLG
ncbi:sulfite exporter TauE/SafE family protein [Notoacmeibacter ruber]|uniref:Probable membrane transporter protein n=1 Tax=Notoacmeibacter ruber TaxID=2670375 RepID=A0A3L7J9A3_9HYPH|nr:sulfite exporter TauE/SafE family protein [Notoacmeibacter ruber]RLQ87263.1 sulfite exporter TauE/SafE family protein [Notoacmeibacter ruber]